MKRLQRKTDPGSQFQRCQSIMAGKCGRAGRLTWWHTQQRMGIQEKSRVKYNKGHDPSDLHPLTKSQRLFFTTSPKSYNDYIRRLILPLGQNPQDLITSPKPIESQPCPQNMRLQEPFCIQSITTRKMLCNLTSQSAHLGWQQSYPTSASGLSSV